MEEDEKSDQGQAVKLAEIQMQLIDAAHSVAVDMAVENREEPDDLGDEAQMVAFCAGCLEAARTALALGNELADAISGEDPGWRE